MSTNHWQCQTFQDLTIALGASVTALDPHFHALTPNNNIAQHVFNNLVEQDHNQQLVPGLATSWTAKDDNTWVIKLRPGVKWQSGGDFTADDVIATMDRTIEAGNAGLKGVLDVGASKALDPLTVEFTLTGPNGNFPYLVSVFNAQTLITPKNYATGTTLDKQPDGTGAWKLQSYDNATGAVFVRNENWWGGKTALDSVEWAFYDKVSDMVTSYQGQVVDAIVQFSVIDGSALFDDASFNVIATRTATHREIWMRTDKGQFKDKRVRQALALTFDRQAMVDKLFKGRADIGNDHVIAPMYPYFDPATPAQRTKDVEQAKALLAAAGVTNLKAVLHTPDQQEIPDLAVLIQSGAKEAGITVDYRKLLSDLTRGRSLVRAYAYTGIDPANDGQKAFQDFLRENGYTERFAAPLGSTYFTMDAYAIASAPLDT